MSRVALLDVTNQGDLPKVLVPPKIPVGVTHSTSNVLYTYRHDPYAPVQMYDVDMTPQPAVKPFQAAPLSFPLPYSSLGLLRIPPSGTPNTSPTKDSTLDESGGPTDLDVTSNLSEVETNPEEEVVTVRFQHHHGTYLNHRSHLALGDYVVVEGDRGIDVGVLAERCSKVVVSRSSRHGSTTPPKLRVLRRATEAEKCHLTGQHGEAQDRALRFIRHSVEQLGLPMNILCCEAQFDWMKLSVWFEAEKRVMFQSLLRALYAEFGCRIWMYHTNRKHNEEGKEKILSEAGPILTTANNRPKQVYAPTRRVPITLEK